MQKQIAKSYAEMMGLYGTTLEFALRANKLIAEGAERVVREQIDFADAAVAQISPLAKAQKPQELFDAQTALMKEMGEQVVLTAKNVLKIQQETGADLKALMDESTKSLLPANLNSWLAKAA